MGHKRFILRSRRSGVTLLELILALALSIMVLMAISMAINLHFKMLDVRRTNVEESQLARVVLRHMADDLRGTLMSYPPDLSGLEALSAMASSAATSAASSMVIGQGSLGGQSGSGGGGGASQSSSGPNTTGVTAQALGTATPPLQTQPQTAQTPLALPSTSGGGGSVLAISGGGVSSATSTAVGSAGSAGALPGSSASSQQTATGGTTTSAAGTTTTGAPVVGLIGTATELRIDISRLPRIDQYQGTSSSDGALRVVDIPSDVKTVAYFLLSEQAAGNAGGPHFASSGIEPSTTGRGKGLMRSEQDRAVTAWSEANGGTTSAYDGGQMLAAEVVGLEFQYFDGSTWVPEWDSTSMGSLPKAVEILLTLQPTYALSERELARTTKDSQAPEHTYRMVVSLPSSPLVPTTTTTDATAAGTGTSTSTQGATSQGTTTGTSAQGPTR